PDVGELLGRLTGEEGGGLQGRSAVEPVPDLDAGHLAVEELVDDPSQEGAVARKPEARSAEIEAQLVPAHAHGLSRCGHGGTLARQRTRHRLPRARSSSGGAPREVPDTSLLGKGLLAGEVPGGCARHLVTDTRYSAPSLLGADAAPSSLGPPSLRPGQ